MAIDIVDLPRFRRVIFHRHRRIARSPPGQMTTRSVGNAELIKDIRKGNSPNIAQVLRVIVNQWIGLRENLQESPMFNGKIYGFL